MAYLGFTMLWATWLTIRWPTYLFMWIHATSEIGTKMWLESWWAAKAIGALVNPPSSLSEYGCGQSVWTNRWLEASPEVDDRERERKRGTFATFPNCIKQQLEGGHEGQRKQNRKLVTPTRVIPLIPYNPGYKDPLSRSIVGRVSA